MTNEEAVKNSKQAREYLTQIKQTSEEASELIKNILTYSQSSFMANGNSRLIENLVGELIEQHKLKLPNSIKLTHHIEKEIPPLYLDAQQFKRMFDVICLNALEAIEGEGSIIISLHQTTLDGEKCSATGKTLKGQFIELSIEDTGRGISAENLEHIFEPFFTTKDLSAGAGMGLATAFGFIEKNNGNVILESTEGKGTKFRVILPTSDRRS